MVAPPWLSSVASRIGLRARIGLSERMIRAPCFRASRTNDGFDHRDLLKLGARQTDKA
ncbi:hypothetical protein BN11_1080025 [Nostocoides australiense Ben110]|uniref:Uncharacterized protein n=1 Tax=Nostocoides australiense Ben110 TaxID=1193182 RepID=W6JTJ7_9MICO|nr:hypothetical protein BN11_1080025 [Tetrasphaera australiensis Ben110]